VKILLIAANTHTAPYPVYPLGLDYVAGALAPAHTVERIDLNALDPGDALERTVRDFQPRLIGIGLRNVDSTDASDLKSFIQPHRRLVARLRQLSDAWIVVGGSGFTIFPSEIMAALQADFGIIGEGERLTLLVAALEQQQDPLKVSGVVNSSAPAAFPPPWPGPPHRQLPDHGPGLDYYLQNGGMLNLQTKRGCPFRCIYCTYPHIEGRRMRLISPEKVAQTARELQAAGAKYFFITDSAFNADLAHSQAVARAFIQAGVTIPWGAFCAPVSPPADYFQLMARAGMQHVEFGTEALTRSVLAAYGKPFTPGQVHKAHAAALAAGLHVAHYLLLGGPGETPQTLEQTLKRAAELTRCVIFLFCGMRIYPHTGLYDLARQEGLLDPRDNLLDPVFYHSADMDPASIMARVIPLAEKRPNWIVGSGGDQTQAIITRMYARGYSGPLWEYLIR